MRFATKFDRWVVIVLVLSATTTLGVMNTLANIVPRGLLLLPATIWPMSDSRSAGVYSTDRVLVITQQHKRYIIAPAEQQRFMGEVAKRTPQLKRKSFGLALPFSMHTVI